MKDLLLIALGAGLRDGLNPCMLMTCAVFIVYGLWLNKRSLPVFGLCSVFVLIYGLSSLAFNFGPGQIFVLQKYFMITARIIYFILGAGSFVFGVLYFKDWLSLVREGSLKDQAVGEFKILSVGGVLMCLMAVVLGVGLSALSTYWPASKYVIVLGNEALIKGQWGLVMPMLLSYVVVSMWLLWFVWAFLSIKNIRPSLLRIVCSSIFFAASSCMILLFK